MSRRSPAGGSPGETHPIPALPFRGASPPPEHVPGAGASPPDADLAPEPPPRSSGPSIDVEPPEPDDRLWMARALEMARRAASVGEVPVGAVLVREGRILAEGHNLTVSVPDPTAHAEVVVLREAARRLGDWRLTDATLYATLEPCALCAGAVVLARIPRLVYAAADPKAGMAESLGNLLQDDRLNHRVRLTRGVLADASAELLRGFFRERRQ